MRKTKLLPCDEAAVALAARLLQQGELVAMPTETVYGLAADATNPAAVREIFRVKGRPADNPLIVHIAALDMWAPLVRELPDGALRLAEAFWPGPLTIVLPKSGAIPDEATVGLPTVAVRMPSHLCARALIKAAGRPLAAPSANRSGSPSPTAAAHCLADLDGEIPLILDAGPCEVGIESTVLSLAGPPTLLRPGAITAGQLEDVLKTPVTVAPSILAPLSEGEHPASPGMKYRHYAPKARLVLVQGSLRDYLAYLEAAPEGTWGLVFSGEEALTARPCVAYGAAGDPASQERGLFSALRWLDQSGATLIYARSPDSGERSMGIYNRMLRAAAFEVVQP